MATFTAGTSFTDGVTGDVTAAKLNALVANATPLSNFITDRTAETSIATDDLVLISDTSDSGALNKMTVANLMKAEITGTINSTAGTITTATIPTLTAGTTTGTAATFTSGTITTGVIPTLTSTTLITSGTGTAAAPAIVPTGDTNTGIFFPAADTIAFSEGGTESVRIDSSGKVLIGTTSNDTGGRLEVKQASSETGIGIQSSGTDDSKLYFRTASGSYGGDILFNGSYVKFSSGTTERLRIDSSGRVGINVTSPLYRLQVDGDVGLTDTSSLYWATAGGTTRTSITGDSSGNLKLQTGASNTERLRITSDGLVCIGTTTGIGRLTLEDAGGSLTSTPLTINSTSGAGDRYSANFYYSGVRVGSITVGASATAFNTSSDYRLKTNIEPISNGIDRIKQLPVYRFNWITNQDGNKVDGFVAHEVTPVVPEAISGEKDAVDADGKPIYQGIDQSKIVPLLTAALKEAIAKIETLEAKVTALEAA